MDLGPMIGKDVALDQLQSVTRRSVRRGTRWTKAGFTGYRPGGDVSEVTAHLARISLRVILSPCGEVAGCAGSCNEVVSALPVRL